jgi:N-acyl-D-aspartate/D-glutamate deacylase
MHTRLHGLTNLSVALPAWAYQGGPDELRRRLRSPQTRAEFARHDSLLTSLALGGWRNVSVLTSAARPDLIGKNFEEIGLERATTPFDAVLDLLLDEAADPHHPLILAESYTEAQLLEAYRHPACLVASNATALGVDGPLAGKVFHGAFTWASWFFRRFVREERVFTVEQAVRKLTGQAAARLNLSDRGVLREGACADVVAFDPHTYGDQGTLNDPNRLARGTVHVVVNGVAERQKRPIHRR